MNFTPTKNNSKHIKQTLKSTLFLTVHFRCIFQDSMLDPDQPPPTVFPNSVLFPDTPDLSGYYTQIWNQIHEEKPTPTQSCTKCITFVISVCMWFQVRKGHTDISCTGNINSALRCLVLTRAWVEAWSIAATDCEVLDSMSSKATSIFS